MQAVAGKLGCMRLARLAMLAMLGCMRLARRVQAVAGKKSQRAGVAKKSQRESQGQESNLSQGCARKGEEKKRPAREGEVEGRMRRG